MSNMMKWWLRRRDHSSAWRTANPVLAEHEVLHESDTDTGTFRVAAGKTPYGELTRYRHVGLEPLDNRSGADGGEPMSNDKARGSKIVMYGTNDILWCGEHGRYEQFSAFTTADGAITEQVSHHPVPINPATGLP